MSNVNEEFNSLFSQKVKFDKGVTITQVIEDGVKKFVIRACPDIGDIFISTNSTSPAIKFGGTWTRIKDVFLLAAGDTYAAGSTGGSRYLQSHTHTIDHDHPSAYTGTETSNHTHGISDPVNVWGGSPSNPGNYLNGGSSSSPPVFYTDGGTGFTTTRGRNSEGTSSTHTHLFDVPNYTGTSGSTGSGNAENMPPYRAVYVWERTA